jgi:hypothetical protein
VEDAEVGGGGGEGCEKGSVVGDARAHFFWCGRAHCLKEGGI